MFPNNDDPYIDVGQSISGSGQYCLSEWTDLTITHLDTDLSEYFNASNKSTKGLLEGIGSIVKGMVDGSTAVTYKSIDIAPASNIDAIDIDGTGMTTASAIDLDMSARTGSTTGVIDILLQTSTYGTDETVFNIKESRAHDDGGADDYKAFYVAHSGAIPGTNASTTHLFEGVYSGTIGASGAAATVKAIVGDISGATVTAGTAMAGYFTDGTRIVEIANGTNALSITGNIAIDGTGVTTGHLIDINTTALTTGSIIDIEAITTKTSGYLYNGSMTTSTLDATTILDDFSVSCDHDDVAADTLRMIRRTWSGDLPGSQAEELVIMEALYTGTIGSAGGDAILYAIKGDLSNATITDGTVAAGYFADTNSVLLLNNETNVLDVTASAATNAILGVSEADNVTYFADLSGCTGGNGTITSDSGTAATTWKARIKVKTDDGTDGWINVYSTSNEA